jgi:hypothetical protein
VLKKLKNLDRNFSKLLVKTNNKSPFYTTATRKEIHLHIIQE